MAEIVTDKSKINEVFGRYVEAVFPSKERALELMASGKRLTFYLGVDPTGPDLHLGHTTNFFVLKKLIGLGHKVILLIGDFTAQTGDPTGKDTARKSLTVKEVESNMKTYLKQAVKILPKGSFDLRHNSRWLGKLNFNEIRKLARQVTVQQMIARDMFQRRMAEDRPVTLEEFLYPLMQGYDSVAMKVDGEVGGTDQTFNMMVGRDLVKSFLNKDKIVITTKLLEDSETGKKLMNKSESEGRYVSLNDSAQEMFGRIMSLADSAILPLFKYATELSDETIAEIETGLKNGENPKKAKEELSFELVKMYHGEKEAQKAKNEFEHVFGQHELPEKMEEIEWKGNILDTSIIAGIVVSKGEIKRLVEQGAVRLDDKVIENWNENMEIKEEGSILKIGPRKFYKVKPGK
ncbi:MAG: tyrosine--tRNA ligase [Candidatus Yanofskybacteria bacterium]|nr:tyrosine--tRNA ligase [Candidatus Yanofskybacteria bacterium]